MKISISESLLISLATFSICVPIVAGEALATPAPSAISDRQMVQGAANWLFVQTAMSGTLEKMEGKSNQYTLQLSGVSPSMVTFADRPVRSAGVMSTAQFVSTWYSNSRGDNFRDSPPNAALVISSGSGDDTFVFTLENPKYDEKMKVLSYVVTSIKVIDKQGTIDLQGKEIVKDLPKAFEQSVLFIDDAWGSLGG
ncbi:MAG: hypothetical protein JWO53_1254 [Chlamydiia bacterium]|nr:hypothetical protein [Chlamydiia bacterium]